MPREAISKGQIKAIHAAIAAAGIDDDTYRVLLRERYQVTTCKALSRIQAGLLLDELAAKSRRAKSPLAPLYQRGGGGISKENGQAKRTHTWPAPERPGRPGGTITEKQQAYIGRLFEKLGWAPNRCVGLCTKVLGRPWPQTNNDVDRLLRVLLPMAKRYPSGGYDRATGGA